jgi:hypothetical protein
MPDSKYRISGALFAKTSPNGPVYSGIIEIDGVKHNIALWEKTSAKGNQYLQISEDKKAKPPGTTPPAAGGANRFQRPAPTPKKPNDDMDDDIPF